MSIQSEIDRINTNIANAYDAVDTMGGTLPVTQNSANLPDAIATLAQTDYIQLEYIESTGMQYIDTGIYPNANTGIEADFAYVASNSAITPNQQRLFGINSNISGYTEINISFYNNGSNPTKWAFSHNSGAIGNWTNTGVNADANRHTLTYNKQNDGKLVIKTGSTTNYDSTMGGTIGITSQYTLPIFCELNGSQLIYKNFSQVRLYSFKIYDGNTLVRDYIPVMRTTDYEVGLYDKVNNIFYGNAGHGSFTPGIKINGYSQLFWIKSDGAAWFDTGVSGGSKMEYSIVLNTLGARYKNYEQYFSGDAYPVSHKIYLNGTSGTSPVCAQQTSGNNWSGTSSNTLNIYTNAAKKQTVAFESDGKLYVATLTADSGVDFKGTGLNNGWGTLSYYVFNSHEENTLPSSMQLLHLKMKKDTDTVRFYIPMKRTSDNKYGVYDLVNNTFTPSATNTAFTRSSVLITDDGTNSPYYSLPVVVPSPSTKSGSIANQIDRINENIANAYDVCRQIGRTLPYVQDSELLEPTILDTLSTAIKLYYYLDTTNHTLYLRRTPKTGYTDGSQALNATTTSDVPWWNYYAVNEIDRITIEEKIYTNSLYYWFESFFPSQSHSGSTILDGFNLLVTKGITSMNYVFGNYVPEEIYLPNIDTSSVTSMLGMFSYSLTLKHLDLSNFDTSNVTTMERMFEGCSNLEYLDLSSFDMSNVTNTYAMFYGCSKVQTAYCRTRADKVILDQAVANEGYSWRFTVKS